MVGTGGNYTKQNRSEGERHLPNDFTHTHVWSKINKTKEHEKQALEISL